VKTFRRGRLPGARAGGRVGAARGDPDDTSEIGGERGRGRAQLEARCAVGRRARPAAGTGVARLPVRSVSGLASTSRGVVCQRPVPLASARQRRRGGRVA
jgi:hypothetical protein